MYRQVHGLMLFIALSCILALTSTGLLHALIPHHHGAADSHEHEQRSSVWTELHQALHLGQKKSMAMISESMMLLVVVLAFAAYQMPRRTFSLEVISLDPHVGRLLRRGISPHRAFR